MVDSTKGEVAVKLSDGREVTLAFDVNAFIDIAEHLGMEVPEVVAKLRDKKNPPGLKFQRAVMWGGLQKHHPELTIRDAGEIMVEAAEAMAKSIGAAMPEGEREADDEVETDPPMPRRGAGRKR